MIPADDDLELYYTSLPDAQSGDFDISRTKRKNCPVKDRDEDKDFYIRAINPDTIEYGIGEICEDGVFDEKTIKVIGERLATNIAKICFNLKRIAFKIGTLPSNL